MKKKILCLLLALSMLFALAACGGGTQGNATPTPSGGEGDEGGEKVTKVIYIGGSLGDAGIADATYEGFTRALEELPIEGKFVELPADPSAYKATLLDACESDADLIFSSANNGMIDEVLAAAPDYPEKKFMVLDTSLTQEGVSDLDNFVGILCSQNEVSYLTGYLGMRMSQSQKIGIVVGVEYPTLCDFAVGYISGALAANPDAQVAVSASGDFVDQAAAKETALAQIRQGCDVVYAVGAGSSFGTLEACKESGVWGIGCDTDLAAQFIGVDDAQADCIITSAYKDWGTVSYNWIKDCIENPDQVAWGSVQVYGIANNGCKIIENDIYNKQVPEDIRAEISALSEKIAAGEVKCPSYFDMSEEEYQALKESVTVK
jgi:basic membrane protein A